MSARNIVCVSLMVTSVLLVVVAYKLGSHVEGPTVVLVRGDFIFYPSLAVAMATFVTALVALFELHKSPLFSFLLSLCVFGIYWCAPIAVASALGKSPQWANMTRAFIFAAVALWTAVVIARSERSKPGS